MAFTIYSKWTGLPCRSPTNLALQHTLQMGFPKQSYWTRAPPYLKSPVMSSPHLSSTSTYRPSPRATAAPYTLSTVTSHHHTAVSISVSQGSLSKCPFPNLPFRQGLAAVYLGYNQVMGSLETRSSDQLTSSTT